MITTKIKLPHSLLALSCLSLATSCTTIPQIEEEPKLKPGLSRIAFKYPDRRPNLFKEKLFGRLSSLTDDSGSKVDLGLSREQSSIRFIDVPPGSYKLKAECEPVNNHYGKQDLWLANYSVMVGANETVRLTCEYYYPEEVDSTWNSQKRDSEKETRRVRIIKLSSNRR